MQQCLNSFNEIYEIVSNNNENGRNPKENEEYKIWSHNIHLYYGGGDYGSNFDIPKKSYVLIGVEKKPMVWKTLI